VRTSVFCLSFLALIVAVPVMARQSAGVGLRLIVVKTEQEAESLRNRVQGGEALPI